MNTGRFHVYESITADPEPTWTATLPRFRWRRWLVTAAAVAAVEAAFWAWTGDPIVGAVVAVSFAVTVAAVAGFLARWDDRDALRALRTDVEFLKSVQTSDRADFLELRASLRNDHLDATAAAKRSGHLRSLPTQRDTGGAS